MKIVHYIDADYEDGAFGGVSRFDHELKKALPDMHTWTKAKQGPMNKHTGFPDDTIVIAGNDACLDVHEKYKCIVVHHGCAKTHLEREPAWMGHHYVMGQARMKYRGNNWYVSPSKFCSDEFERHHKITSDFRVLHSVPISSELEIMKARRVIGDWRNFNKGEQAIEQLRHRAPDWEFIQLQCDPSNVVDKIMKYNSASIYLTLSLSEGCSYSQLDALALGLPVLSTDVSLFGGDADSRCGISFSWKDRDNHDLIYELLEEIYHNHKTYDPRAWMSSLNNFASWKNRWRGLVQEVYNS